MLLKKNAAKLIAIMLIFASALTISQLPMTRVPAEPASEDDMPAVFVDLPVSSAAVGETVTISARALPSSQE